MKKYPFSKKVASIMLATALVVTPLATAAPVGGTTVVSAAEADISQDIERFKLIYDKLSDAGKAEYYKVMTSINGFSDSDWDYILGGVKNEIENKITGTKTAKDIVKDAFMVIYSPTGSAFGTAVENYRSTYSTQFNEIFSGQVTVDLLLQFFRQAERELWKNDMDLATKYLSSEITAEQLSRQLRDRVVSSNQALFGTLNNDLRNGIGVDIDGLFDMKSRLDEKLDPSVDKNRLKTSFMAAVILAGHPDSTPGDSGGDIGGGTGGGTPEPTEPAEPAEPAPGNVILPDDVKKVETVVREDGRSSQVVTVDAEKLTEAIKAEEKVDRVTLFVETVKGEVAEVRVPAKAFTAISEKNPNAQVEVASTEGAYRLPVKEVNLENLAKDLGATSGEDVSISIQVSETEDTSGALTKGNLTAASRIVEFKVVASSGDKEVTLNRFSSFVEREIVGDKDFDANKSIAVQLLDDGTFRAVPTVFDGKRATFKSLTNSRYTIIENTASFPDVVGDYWAKGTIETLASKYIFRGFDDGEFKPRNETTRVQVALLITRSLGLTTDTVYDGEFKDVKGTEWYAKDIMPAIETGIIRGSNGEFRPNDAITREEAAAMFARALRFVQYDDSNLDATKVISSYNDASDISKWAEGEVEYLLQAGVMTGRTNGNFAGKEVNNRAETAALLTKYLKAVGFMN